MQSGGIEVIKSVCFSSIFSFRHQIIYLIFAGFVVVIVKIFLLILKFAGQRAHVAASLHVVVDDDNDDADTNLEKRIQI